MEAGEESHIKVIEIDIDEIVGITILLEVYVDICFDLTTKEIVTHGWIEIEGNKEDTKQVNKQGNQLVKGAENEVILLKGVDPSQEPDDSGTEQPFDKEDINKISIKNSNSDQGNQNEWADELINIKGFSLKVMPF